MGATQTTRWSFGDVEHIPKVRRESVNAALDASRAPRFRAMGRFRVWAQRSRWRGAPLHERTAYALQSFAVSERSTWRWGLVNEETA